MITPEQREALYIARYALDRVIGLHTNPPDDIFPKPLHDAVSKCLDEIDEALPVGDLGEKPVTLILGKLREAKRRALEVNGYTVADTLDEARALIVLGHEESWTTRGDEDE